MWKRLCIETYLHFLILSIFFFLKVWKHFLIVSGFQYFIHVSIPHNGVDTPVLVILFENVETSLYRDVSTLSLDFVHI